MKELFLQVYAAARAQLPTLPGLNPLGVTLADSRSRPMLYLSLSKLAPMQQTAYDKFKGGTSPCCRPPLPDSQSPTAAFRRPAP